MAVNGATIVVEEYIEFFFFSLFEQNSFIIR